MKSDSSELKTELNQLTEMKYAFAECTYRLNLIIAKEKSIIQSLENSEDYGVSSIKGYRNTIKKSYQSQANHLMNLISCSHYLTKIGDKENCYERIYGEIL
ncbi:MAG: hypothetical protein IJE48_08305 [Clostridia bacterium]|nr:hypothetical protein [Clostridia bacterium]